jgi:hypothetical protein
MILGEKRRDPILRDTYIRLTPQYNTNYNPYAILRNDLPVKYSPYVFKEPLHDDRPIIVKELLKNCVVAPLAKRTRSAWVWRLGYAINDSFTARKAILM